MTDDTRDVAAIADGDEIGAASKDPREQQALARDIGEELTDIFVSYVRGDITFADLTFLTFESLENLHIVAGGEYELEYEDEDDGDNEYDIQEATEEQEDLAQEPARETS